MDNVGKVLTVYNIKGGVGKTTIACNMGLYLCYKGYKVLVVDTDSQASTSAFFYKRFLTFSESTESTDLEATPSVIQLLTPDIHKRLKDFLPMYDYIIIDSGGRDNSVARSALVATDCVVVPVLPSPFDIWASEEALQLIDEVQSMKDLQVYLLVNMMFSITTLSKEVVSILENLKTKYTFSLCESMLAHRVIYKKLSNDGLGVVDSNSLDLKALEEFKQFCESINL